MPHRKKKAKFTIYRHTAQIHIQIGNPLKFADIFKTTGEIGPRREFFVFYFGSNRKCR